jgi:D-alanyl-D-alanine carboxypeptidase
MKLSRSIRAVLAAALLASASGLQAVAGPSLLVEADTGRVLAQEDAFQRWYPASLTKLMTAYVAFRSVQSGEMTMLSPVKISKKAAAEPPSKMAYAPGSVLTLDNALKIIMVKSANDVATAIGESVAGTEAAFAARMNMEARRLGMSGSHFVNANGLHSDAQFTTARDLALLALALRKEFPQHAGYFSLEAIGAGGNVIKTHNTMIGRFDGADGMKTGYTCPAGFNLVASATRGGKTLIAVVIGATSVETRADQAADLLAAGFGQAGLTAPLLANLTPEPGAAGLAEAVNMRETVCAPKPKPKAKAKPVAEAKPAETRRFKSLHLRDEPLYPPRVEQVALGGATGPMSPALKAVEESQIEYVDVPIPLPRPEYPPVAKDAQAKAAEAGVTQ